MRNLKCHHETTKTNDNDSRIIFQGMVDERVVLEIWYDKDAKNKVRSFYRQFFGLISGFFEELESKNIFPGTKDNIIKRLLDYKTKNFKIKNEEEEYKFG